ncbi:MAG: alternate-type signal peptide domain-containing protein [Dietzia sp.]
MNKTTKGALAAGAAALLLAGGAGTYAAWTDTAPDTDGASVTTGHLAVDQVADSASWTWQSPGVAGEIFDPATDTLAPGDSVRFTGSYDLAIEGTNLSAELIATSGTGALPAGMTWTADEGNNLANLTEANDGDTVTVGGTLAFDASAEGSMDETVAVDDLTVTITQTPMA